MTEWCVYVLVDPRDGKHFYVGCSKEPKERACGHRNDPASSAYWRVKEIHAAGHKCFLRVVARYKDKDDAMDHENRLIMDGFVNGLKLLNRLPSALRPRKPTYLWTEDTHNCTL